MILFRKRHEGITWAATVGIAVLLQVVVTYVLASLLGRLLAVVLYCISDQQYFACIRTCQ